MTGTECIEVAAGILVDASGRILLTERLGDSPFAGLWEFPGGKLHPGETAEAAMRRELAEELGIVVGACERFMDVQHAYAERTVALEFFLVRHWQGEPAGCDGQALQWRDPQTIKTSELLPADAPVLLALKKQVAARRNVLAG